MSRLPEKDYNGCTGRHHVGTIDPCWPGAFAEYYLAPVRHVYKLAPNVSLKEAAFCEPLSVAWGGVKKMKMDADSVVCVIGTGSIAMAAAALPRYRGAGQVYVVGRNAFKLEKARSLGITGTINTKDGEFYSHLHMSAADENAHVYGGHLVDATISATCEMVIRVLDGTVDRYFDEETGLNLFKFY